MRYRIAGLGYLAAEARRLRAFAGVGQSQPVRRLTGFWVRREEAGKRRDPWTIAAVRSSDCARARSSPAKFGRSDVSSAVSSR